jgi:N-acetylglucosaminyl-diphospho-decaprenol L-rhamnosyltransferase
MYCEEIDWCLRARRAGWEILCVPRSVITHLEGRSAAAFRERMLIELWRSRFRLFRKHYGRLYRMLAGFIVRAGMAEEMRRTRHALAAGALIPDQAQQRLDAYRRVQEMAHA